MDATTCWVTTRWVTTDDGRGPCSYCDGDVGEAWEGPAGYVESSDGRKFCDFVCARAADKKGSVAA